MSVYIPAPTPDPLLQTLGQYIQLIQYRKAQEEAEAKESGAFLSGAGAASGAAAGAGIGLALAPFTAGLSVPVGLGMGTTLGTAGAVGGTIAGAAIGAGVGAVAGPKRMHPGKGPNAQPGNIDQQNAMIMQGIMGTGQALAGAYAFGKTREEKAKLLIPALDAFEKTLGLGPGVRTTQQQGTALGAFVAGFPQEQRSEVIASIGERLGPEAASSAQSMAGIFDAMDVAAGVSGAPGAPGAVPAAPGRGLAAPGAAARPGMGQIQPRGGQQAPQQPPMSPQQQIMQRAAQTQKAIDRQMRASGMHREWAPQDIRRMGQIRDQIEAVRSDPGFSTKDKIAAIERLGGMAGQIKKRISIAPRVASFQEQLLTGDAGIIPGTRTQFWLDPDGKRQTATLQLIEEDPAKGLSGAEYLQWYKDNSLTSEQIFGVNLGWSLGPDGEGGMERTKDNIPKEQDGEDKLEPKEFQQAEQRLIRIKTQESETGEAPLVIPEHEVFAQVRRDRNLDNRFQGWAPGESTVPPTVSKSRRIEPAGILKQTMRRGVRGIREGAGGLSAPLAAGVAMAKGLGRPAASRVPTEQPSLESWSSKIATKEVAQKEAAKKRFLEILAQYQAVGLDAMPPDVRQEYEQVKAILGIE